MSQLILKSAEAGSGSITITAQETNEDINIVFPSTSGTLFVGSAEGYAPINNPTFTGIVKGSFKGNLDGLAVNVTQRIGLTAKGDIGYTNVSDDNNVYLADRATLAWWNGAYSDSNKSNLTYCANGTIVGTTGNQTIGGTKTFSSQIKGSISGNAGTATKLATARTITVNGDATGSISFDGGADATLTLDVAQATKATQDGSGRTITSTYIPKTGDAGTVSVYTTVGTNTTINDSSPDACQTASAVTVSNGTSNKSWVKIVRLTGSSPQVTLGTSWKWQGGSAPTLSQNGFLVLGWCGSGGIAIFNAVS